MRYLTMAIGALVIIASFAIGRVTAPAPAAAAMQPDVKFSHFECYMAQMKPIQQEVVQLTDQFQSYKTTVGAPQFFCTPVTKKVLSGVNMRVPLPANHLACYQIKGPAIQQSRPYTNQFIMDTVTVGVPQLLCVPTNKQG